MSIGSPDTSWHLTETYKSLIAISVEALKLLVLVNGGAAIALLAYLGSFASRASAGVSPPNLVWPLSFYSLGVFVTVLAFGISYVTQLRLYNEEINIRAGYTVPRVHAWLLWVGIALALGAAVAFGIGCVLAALTIGGGGVSH
jgi:hypothetical protein